MCFKELESDQVTQMIPYIYIVTALHKLKKNISKRTTTALEPCCVMGQHNFIGIPAAKILNKIDSRESEVPFADHTFYAITTRFSLVSLIQIVSMLQVCQQCTQFREVVLVLQWEAILYTDV